MKKKDINIFNISFLDLISGALGAVIILFITVSKGHLSKEVLESETLSKTQKENLEMNSKKIKDLESEIKELQSENSKILAQLSKENKSENSKISSAKKFEMSIKSIFKEIFSGKQNFSKLEIDESVTLENVYFYPGTTTFLPGYKKNLETLVAFLKSNDVKIEVQGHIFWPKSVPLEKMDHIDQKISTQRAQKVCDYLIANNIEKERLKCIGLGGSFQKVLTDDEAEGTENRRIEIKIIE